MPVGDGVGVFDDGVLAGVKGEASSGLVVESQPDFLDRVPVGLDLPAHGLVPVVSVPGLEADLVPAQRVFPVEQVGALRVAGVPVDRDAHQVAGDRLGADVTDPAAHAGPVPAVAVLVGQLGVVVDHQQPGRAGFRGARRLRVGWASAGVFVPGGRQRPGPRACHVFRVSHG